MSATVVPYDDLTADERARTLAELDRLTLASQVAWLEDRTDLEDWREYVVAWARKLDVRLWPALLERLRADAPHAPGWLRQEAADLLAEHFRTTDRTED